MSNYHYTLNNKAKSTRKKQLLAGSWMFYMGQFFYLAVQY